MSGSLPPNQAAKREVYILTTSQSRRRGIQPITAVDPAQLTKPTTAAFLIQTALLSGNFRKSNNQTALLKANLEKSS